MLMNLRCTAAALLSVFLLVPAAASAAGVEVLFDPDDRSRTIFPSDLFTVLDFSQNTFRRVDLPKPDCAINVVRCDDVDVLNTLDGFNIQPRVSIPFSGPIDLSTVNSDSIFLVSLGSTQGRGSVGERIGINQVVWDTETNTLNFEPDTLLEQHTRYAVIVTDRVRDAQGRRLDDKPLGSFLRDRRFRHDKERLFNEYREQLLEGFLNARRHQGGDRVVAASVFTTMSTSGTLERIRDQIKVASPQPVSFNIGASGERAVFPLGTITSAAFSRQVGTAPTFTTSQLPLPALNVLGPVVSSLAFGRYASPNYLSADVTMPPLGSRTGVPVPQAVNDVYFNLVLPAGTRPASGWPVAIFGHGFGDSKFGAFFVVAASMAQQGIATVAINVVGHGGGPLGVLALGAASGTVVVPAGGRGLDQNGDGAIGTTEGSAAAAPRSLIGSADALRQTTVDLMQLVRQIQAGIDVDGDGTADLDPWRIYYFGQSFGGIYGTIFLGVERDVRVGVPNVPGGPIIDIIRLSPVFRPSTLTPVVVARGLANLPQLPSGLPQFDENLPFRNEPPRINNVPGAMALQDFIDQSEWANQAGNPVAYAPFLRKAPLRGNAAKSVIIQYAKGDQTVPNPTATAIVRAGALQDRATFFRNDLAFALGAPRNPHTFLTNIAVPGVAQLAAFQGQAQIAAFFASDGALTIDPDGANPLFETPIVLPLPETLNFLP
jgi:hypothetical protein